MVSGSGRRSLVSSLLQPAEAVTIHQPFERFSCDTSRTRALLFAAPEMSEATCSACGAELIPGTGFCRQCGTPVAGATELPTAILNQTPDGTTQRLDPRTTHPYPERAAASSH